MGLKLKWFRRRLTFEGIPSAPERSTRKKEQNTGITVIGVYRQSVNYEDYIEPSRSSYSWEPASHPFVTTTIRKPATSVPASSSTAASTSVTTTLNSSIDKRTDAAAATASPDKIAQQPSKTKSTTPIETPPQPTYSPPKPPVRKSLTKTKSTPNIPAATASLDKPILTLEVTRSVEVLNEESVPLRRTPAARSQNVHDSDSSGTEVVALFNERSVDGDSLGSFRKVKSTTRSPPPEVVSPLVEIAPSKEEEAVWKQEQPEFFNEILQKVNGLATASKSPELNRSKSVKPSNWEDDPDTESFDDIFQKVKARPRNPADGQESPQSSQSIVEAFPAVAIHSRTPSIEDIFEPRTPELAPGEPIPRAPSPKPLKSILKKRAPAPPASPQPQVQPTKTVEIPTPPPRSIRKEEPVPLKRTVSNDKIEQDDNDDDYDTWNMVERHRSSITQTVARVNPEVMRNVPSSLQVPRTQPQLQSEPPRTLRGMRDYHHKQSSSTSNKAGEGDEGSLFLGRHARGARDSESNQSEASA